MQQAFVKCLGSWWMPLVVHAGSDDIGLAETPSSVYAWTLERERRRLEEKGW